MKPLIEPTEDNVRVATAMILAADTYLTGIEGWEGYTEEQKDLIRKIHLNVNRILLATRKDLLYTGQ